MMLIKPEDTFLFIDTETTGFKKSGNAIQGGQARVCQVAMLLTDCVGRSLMEVSTLVKPDIYGWEISEGAYKTHGFTKEQCEAFGIQQHEMMQLFLFMAGKCTKLIAHNAEFDHGMMLIELAHYGVETELREWFCTMKTNTHLTGGKWPKLEEALMKLCQRELGEYAHDAMYYVKT